MSEDASTKKNLPKSSEENLLKSSDRLEVRLADDRVLKIVNIETRYIDEHGKPVSATEFLQTLIGKLPDLYQSEEQLRTLRANPETREKLLFKLADIGVDTEQLESLKKMFEAQDSDIFDILAHISFNTDIKKRVERVAYVKDHKIIFQQYEDLKAQDFLDFVLQQYAEHGIFELQGNNLGNLISLYKKGTVPEMALAFGGDESLKEAYYELQGELFRI